MLVINMKKFMKVHTKKKLPNPNALKLWNYLLHNSQNKLQVCKIHLSGHTWRETILNTKNKMIQPIFSLYNYFFSFIHLCTSCLNNFIRKLTIQQIQNVIQICTIWYINLFNWLLGILQHGITIVLVFSCPWSNYIIFKFYELKFASRFLAFPTLLHTDVYLGN